MLLPSPVPLSRLGATFVFVLALTVQVAAQRYLTHTYGDFHGLPSPRTHAVAQDGDGVIWIATERGMVWTDGTGLELETASSLPQRIAHLETDHEGRIWAVPRARHQGPRVFEHGAWTAIPYEIAEDEVLDVCWSHAPHGDDLVLLTESGSIQAWDGTRWRHGRIPGAQRPTFSTAMAVIGGRLFVASSAGVHRVDLARSPLEATATSVTRPTDAIVWSERDGFGFLVGADWFARFTLREDGAIESTLLREGAPFSPFEAGTGIAASIDSNGGLTFGNTIVVYYYHPDVGLEFQSRTSGLTTEGLTSTITDREGNVWIGTARGVSKVVTRRFATYGRAHGLYEDEVTAILELGDDDFLLGHGGGLTRLGERTSVVDLDSGPVAGRVLDIGRLRDGTVWVAAARTGLLTYDLDEAMATEWVGPAVFGGSVQTLHEDPDGTLWVAGHSGVYRRMNGAAEFERLDLEIDSRVPVYVRRIVRGPDGSLLIATGGHGIVRLRDGVAECLSNPVERRARSCYSIAPQSDGEVWVGTTVGLFRIAGAELERVSNPTIRQPIFSMLRDRAGRSWFGTTSGLLRWDGSRLEPFKVSHGLLGSETNRSALVLDAHGRVVVGTDQGLSVFRDAFDHPPRTRPTVSFRRLETNEGTHSLAGGVPVELGSPVGRLEFRFRAISFGDEKRVRFLAWLEGLDAAWSEPLDLPQRRISFANVPPGRYRLHLVAVSGSGERSEPAVTGTVRILVPVWQRTWFLASIVAAVVLTVGVVINLLAQRRYARRLEDEVRRRTEELRRMEREHARVQRLEALGVLAGGIAHDFNNVLTGVLGNLSMLENDPSLDEEGRRSAQAAVTASLRARSLTQQLLTFSKGGAPVRAQASIGELVRDCVSFLVIGNKYRCEFDLPDGLEQVDIDEDQISQVIHNLVLNAMQAMPEGGVIRIRAANDGPPPSGGDGRFVRVEFADEGRGIPAAWIQRVFDPYFSTKDGGTGLGLATAHSIVEQHGGRLVVRSVEGQGAVFTMWLPVVQATTKRITDTVAPARASSLEGTRVLVMDDEPMLRDVIADMLRLLGCEWETAGDGAEAVEAYVQALDGVPFDVVVMDLTVAGGVGGLEALRRIRDAHPAARVVVASGYSDDPAIAEFRRYGFCARLTKPFRVRDLESALQTALSGDAATQAG